MRFRQQLFSPANILFNLLLSLRVKYFKTSLEPKGIIHYMNDALVKQGVERRKEEIYAILLKAVKQKASQDIYVSCNMEIFKIVEDLTDERLNPGG